MYLVGWPGWLRAAAAATAASAAERSSQSAAHDVAHGRAHSHASGGGGHLSHEARTLGRRRGRGQGRGRWVCRRRRVCRRCRARQAKQPQRLDVNQRFGAIRKKVNNTIRQEKILYFTAKKLKHEGSVKSCVTVV